MHVRPCESRMLPTYSIDWPKYVNWSFSSLGGMYRLMTILIAYKTSGTKRNETAIAIQASKSNGCHKALKFPEGSATGIIKENLDALQGKSKSISLIRLLVIIMAPSAISASLRAHLNIKLLIL